VEKRLQFHKWAGQRRKERLFLTRIRGPDGKRGPGLNDRVQGSNGKGRLVTTKGKALSPALLKIARGGRFVNGMGRVLDQKDRDKITDVNGAIGIPFSERELSLLF